MIWNRAWLITALCNGRVMQAKTMEAKLLMCFLTLLSVYAPAQSSRNVELTRLFSSSANSSCNELSCSSPTQHRSSALLDGDPSSWWQSQEQDEPVLLSLRSSNDLSTYLVTTFRIVLRLPLSMMLTVYTDDELFLLGECQLHSNSSLCAITHETLHTVVEITILKTLRSIHVLLSGYSNHSEEYYSVAEVSISAKVLLDHYLPDPHSIRVEAEDGILFPHPGLFISHTSVPASSNMMLLPDYSGRGFAVFNYPFNTNNQLQIMLNLPANTSYRLVARYINTKQSSFPVLGSVTQEGVSVPIRFTLDGVAMCTPHCYSSATHQEESSISSFELVAGQMTVTLSLDGISCLLDYITAVPEPFFSGNSLTNYSSSNCGIIDHSWEGYTDTEQVCQRQILQISALLYITPSVCDCSIQSLNQSCAVLGGQCFCSSSNPNEESVSGRVCDTCPFYYFLNITGCAGCNCPNDDMCNMSSGQCVCEANVQGRQCDMCAEGSYGSPPQSCTDCNCSSMGTHSCNSTTGQCICLDGVTGDNCSECELDNHFLQSGVCQPCQCSDDGSVSLQCNDTGECMCVEGYDGAHCRDCAVGFYQSVNGCSLCNCSQRTSICRQNENITETSTEVCDCPPEYSGNSCEMCSSGHYLASNMTCIACLCNASLVCNNSTGECVTPVFVATASPSQTTSYNASTLLPLSISYHDPLTTVLISLPQSDILLLPESTEVITTHSFLTTPSLITSESSLHFTTTTTDEALRTIEHFYTFTTSETLSLFESSPFSDLDSSSISKALIPSTFIIPLSISETLSSIHETLSISETTHSVSHTYTSFVTQTIFSGSSKIATSDIMPHTTVLPSDDQLSSTFLSSLLTPSTSSSVASTALTSSGDHTVSPILTDHPLPSPGQDHLVIARLVVPQDDYAMLLQEQSYKKVELEEALALEFMKAILQLVRKSHLTGNTVSKVIEIHPRDSNSGETPVIFYVLAREIPVPATIVVAAMNHAQIMDINGYRVVSISTIEDNQVGVIVGGVLGAALFLCVLIALTLLCVILLWFKTRHRTNRVDAEILFQENTTSETQQLTGLYCKDMHKRRIPNARRYLPRQNQRSESHDRESDDPNDEEDAPAKLFERIAHFADDPANSDSIHPKMKFHSSVFSFQNYSGTTRTRTILPSDDAQDSQSLLNIETDRSAATNEPTQIKASKKCLRLPHIGRSLHSLPFKHRFTSFGLSSQTTAFDTGQELAWMQTGNGVQLIRHNIHASPQHQSLSLAGWANHSHHEKGVIRNPSLKPQSHNQGQLVWSPDTDSGQSQPVDTVQRNQLRDAAGIYYSKESQL